MNVTCPNCATVYRVDPAKVPEAGVRARCAVCSAVFAVHREGAPARASAPAPVASGVSASAAHTASPPAPPSPAPPGPPPRETTPPATHQPIPEPPRRIEAVPEPVRVPGPKVEPPRAEPPRPAAPIAPKVAAAPPPAMPGGALPRPAAPSPPPPRPTAPAASSAPVAPPSATPRATAPAAPARPVNPFLSQDPALKARRLARALISDMVVYHPAKRQEGLRDGNLKQLFEEEIKKSWEEYSDQVGREVADTTNYFREALNEILAGGRQIF
jgi:predicted Zn finger-like uncharacterized protein